MQFINNCRIVVDKFDKAHFFDFGLYESKKGNRIVIRIYDFAPHE